MITRQIFCILLLNACAPLAIPHEVLKDPRAAKAIVAHLPTAKSEGIIEGEVIYLQTLIKNFIALGAYNQDKLSLSQLLSIFGSDINPDLKAAILSLGREHTQRLYNIFKRVVDADQDLKILCDEYIEEERNPKRSRES